LNRHIGVLQRLQGFDGAGKSAGENLAGVEEVAGNENEINLYCKSDGNNAGEHAKEVSVALRFIGRGAVGFAEVDVGGMDESDQAHLATS